MTPREIFEQKLPSTITKEKAEKLGGVYQFVITGDNGGTWFVDLTKSSDWVQAGQAPKPDCTVTVSDADWVGIVDGSVNAQMAFLTGKVKVVGDPTRALKLQQILA